MTNDNNSDTEKQRLSDVSWLFLVMASYFGSEWARRYPPKKTRVIKNAQQEWARVISGYSRGELRCAIDRARKATDLPPSTTDFWKLLESQRVKERYAAERQPKPQNRALGVAMLKTTKAFLADETDNMREE